MQQSQIVLMKYVCSGVFKTLKNSAMKWFLKCIFLLNVARTSANAKFLHDRNQQSSAKSPLSLLLLQDLGQP